MKRLKQAQIIDPLMKPRPEQSPEPVLSRTPHAPEMDASQFWRQRKYNRRTGTWVWVPFLLLATVLFVAPAKTEAANECPTVGYGYVSDGVLQAQYRLRAFGYVLDVDGHFGSRTLKVVQTFQRQNGLAADGVVGPKTQKALGCGLVPAVRVNPPAARPTPSGYSHSNPDVERWHQSALEAGWQESEWRWLSCVIHRESKGQSDALASDSDDESYGLLQLNTKGYLWSWFVKQGLTNPSQLHDPGTNLRIGRVMFEQMGKRPWATSRGSC